MIFRFGRFELDEARRELRLGPRRLELQPRTFDLLVYLVRHHERVVSKDELLQALWPGVIVTDSSVMRAMSLVRSALRAGGAANLIDTFSRQGYRFTGELLDGVPAPRRNQHLARAQAACARGRWEQALQAYRRAHDDRGLPAADFEQWAQAALCVGQPDAAVAPLERAVAAYIQNADRAGAARAALTLANVHLEARAPAVAKGWHRRAGGFLRDEPSETREHGLHAWLTARIALFEGELAEALRCAERAEALARRVGDADVEVLGLVYRGYIELATGQIRAGLVCLDEAGAAILAGTVGPWASGIVFCCIIWANLDRGDLSRAAQWSEQFTRWVQRHTGYGAPGLCRLHHGEVLCNQGRLAAAEAEIRRARTLLAASARYAEGDACRVLGEIRLLRGDLAGAEEAFRQAHELGWHPLPGWALLQAEKGQLAAAIQSLQRGLRSPGWAEGQRRGILLAHLVRLAARAGNRTLARKTLYQLERSTELRSPVGSQALFRRARAALAAVEGRRAAAIEDLRAALALWLGAESAINAAHTRLELAELLARGGDHDEAGLELAAARKAFKQMDAPAMVARCAAARQAPRA
ncbi:winged helix-turn-helix domain-containing protein [Opitutus terrae]|uniref:Transcriptional regulator, CadC n=1 Tax=Opitutus terrae (strain DSM 11246 / JCM 15787 / PB90-1) TaxID=452637 RepID=B1ZTA9_OPITP|nr:winged helix-turn-helix domain-containing protein [Opitutus terrae]ACB76563.1 transcriptional regulator, CadC [Opitutus terrae PB90-1]